MTWLPSPFLIHPKNAFGCEFEFELCWSMPSVQRRVCSVSASALSSCSAVELGALALCIFWNFAIKLGIQNLLYFGDSWLGWALSFSDLVQSVVFVPALQCFSTWLNTVLFVPSQIFVVFANVRRHLVPQLNLVLRHCARHGFCACTLVLQSFVKHCVVLTFYHLKWLVALPCAVDKSIKGCSLAFVSSELIVSSPA